MTNQEIVAKLWNLCNVLRDDGITYHQYVTELTYILFLKMAKETGTEDKIPEKYRWDRLVEKDGLALKKFYEELLRELGEKGTGHIQEIYSGARSNIEEPANLKKIITNINDLDWYSAKEEGLGNLYEGLLEKNANEKKSGAGQYFTPRVLIDVAANIGDAAILSYDCCFPDSVVGFTPGEKCLNKYMYFYLQEIKAELEYIAPATAQKNLNLKLLGKVEIKVPSLKEQEKIVEILEKQINDQENIVEKAENVIETIDVMKKSILAKAFRGELGTNIETEESAIELLKSIF